MRKFYNIDGVITDIIIGIGADPEGRIYEQMARHLLLTLDDLSYNITPTVVSRKFLVEDNGTVPFADDAYKVVSVGLVLNTGAVALLGKLVDSPVQTAQIPKCDCDGCTGKQIDNTVELGRIPNVCTDCLFFNYIEGDVYNGELYAFTEDGFPYGRYFVNEDEARIEFNTAVRAGSTVVIKYHTAVDKYTHKLVAADDYQLVRTATLWNYFQASNRGKAEYFRNLHRMEVSKYKSRRERHTYYDYVDALTSSFNNAVR